MGVSRARSVDANQSEIVKALEGIGAGVRTLQLEMGGLPDLLVGWQKVNYLLEIKTEDGELTPAQVAFFIEWPGQKAIVRSADEALRVLGVGVGPLPETVLSVQEINRYVANQAQTQAVWSMDEWRTSRAPRRYRHRAR